MAITKTFCSFGNSMLINVAQRLAASMRAAWTERSSELTDEVARTLRGGDIAMIKGSNGSRMGPLVAALRDRFAHGAGG